ncbi:unnamed protein product [Protopolystoma xenopodis]|uniref:Uncharacterized protein n=1 Tax=Protopolystoma xenopodis TaxID=117903 RepID=A0A3S5A834_9PLAT|nr:unnamed protein product [Protopolystoma xenopodis]
MAASSRMGKFTLGPDWIPRKLEVEIDLGPRIYTDNKELSPLGPSLDWHLDLRAYRAGGGLQPGEQPLSDGDNAGSTMIICINRSFDQLLHESMLFS